MLRTFYESGLLCFDFASGEWRWALESIRLVALGDDVVDVLCAQMQALGEDAQTVLQYAACLGNSFNLYALAVITRLSSAALITSVCELESIGMLLCTSHSHDLVLLSEAIRHSTPSSARTPNSAANATVSSGSASASAGGAPAVQSPDTAVESSTSVSGSISHHADMPTGSDAGCSSLLLSASAQQQLSSITCVWMHDKIQIAGYKLIPAEKLTTLHCSIAQQLLAGYDELEQEEYAGDLVSHVNSGFLDHLDAIFGSNGNGKGKDGTSPQMGDARRLPGAAPSPSASPPAAAAPAAAAASAVSTAASTSRPDSFSNSSSSLISLCNPSLFPPCWRSLFSSPSMLDRVAELEIVAAKQARGASAYDSAIKLYTAALKLLMYKAMRQLAEEKNGEGEEEGTVDIEAVSTNLSPNHLLAPTIGAMTTTATTMTAVVNSSAAASVSPSPSSEGSSPSPRPTFDFLAVSSSVWSSEYSSCLRIYTDLAQCLFLSSSYQQCLLCVEYILSHVSSVSDRSGLFELHVAVLSQQTLMQCAVDVAKDHLKELGIELISGGMPRDLEQWLFDFSNIHDENSFKLHPLFALEEMPNSTGVTLLTAMCPALFFLHSPLFFDVIYTCLALTRERGIAPETAYALACYGLSLWSQPDKAAEMYAVGRCAKMVLENYGEAGRSILARTNTAVLGGLYQWKLHAREVSRLLENAFDDAHTLGDLEWAGYLGTFAQKRDTNARNRWRSTAENVCHSLFCFVLFFLCVSVFWLFFFCFLHDCSVLSSPLPP